MKKRIASIALSLAMCLTLLPTAAYAEDVSEGGAFDSQPSTGDGAATVAGSNEAVGTTKNMVVYTGENETTTVVCKVSNSDELKNALNNNDNSITEIDITADFTYNGSIATGDKKIVVNEGVTLTIGGSKTKITGKFENNGTITITSSYECIWKAQTTGSGKIVAKNQKWGEYQTYVDYGCVPEENLTNCRINIVKDIDKEPTVILPETMTVGDTITPTVTNLIDGVDISKVFTYKWKDRDSSQIYNGAAKPTLTEAGTLKLNLAAKAPYVMRFASGLYGSLDATGTVQKLTLNTVYVNANSGNNNNIGNTKAAPMKTIGKAIDKVNDGGTIILLSDYTSTALSFDKNVTIKSDDGGKYTVNATYTYIKDNVTATFESVDAQNLTFYKWDNTSHGSGNVVFKNCTGSGIEIADNVISNVTLENSQLGGRFGAQGILTLKNATINGSFSTKDFVAKGKNIYVPEDNRSKVSRIEGTAMIANAVEIQLSAPDATTPYQERKLIETTADASNFTVSSPYQLKKQTEYNGTYIYAFIPVTSVTLAPETLSIEEGKTVGLTATISPANATTQQHSWASENGKIAKVYGETLNTAKVTAIGVGKTTITYTIGGKEASCEVTVTPRTISVESITLNKTQLSLVKGATETLAATVLPTTATDKAVTWKSSDTAVATVENGVVTAVAAGNATITATAGGKTAICAVTVTNPSNSSSSGGGGSSTPRYAVTVPDKTENGSLSVTPKNAKRGSNVTITATPDKGCEVDEIVAKDANGNKLTLKDNGDGTYTFTMPASKVTIEATFTEKQADEPVAPEKLFADVSADDYYYEAVKWASENGVTGGIGENLFGANLPCTRAQIVTFLWRAAGSPEPKGMSGFVDVSADAYYAKAVAWAVEQGIVSGTSATTFSPDAVCTRAQSVTFLYRAFGTRTDKAAGFSDVSADAYYADAVAWAVENGVASGIGGGLFAPDQDCARGQIVAFLYRAYQNK
ncbi:S-layer homology domain-containing protein [Anaerotignum faecicola]